MTAGRTVNTLNKDWLTPRKYANAVTEFFEGEIDLDPCGANGSLIRAKTVYRLPETNGLRESWNHKKIYVNPPYGYDRKNGTSIKDWLRLCAMAYNKNKSEVIALVPVATNTSHWKLYVFGGENDAAASVCFLEDTRLKFLINGSEKNRGSPMACAMVYWGENTGKWKSVFSKFGTVVNLK